MINFIKKIIVYTSLLLFSLLILEYVVFPKNINLMSYKHDLIEKEERQTVIFGNSHTFFGLKPSLFSSNTINIATKGRKLETDYLILKNNINSLKGNKVIILPISFYTLFSNELDKNEELLYYHFFSVKEYNKGGFRNLLLASIPFKELIDDFFFSKVSSKISKLGWRANEDVYRYNDKIIKERVGNPKKKISQQKIIDENIAYLKKFISLCKRNNIELILVLPPYHPDFYKYSENMYYNRNNELLRNVINEDIILIDGKKLSIVNDKYYENVDHLNTLGASVFSKKIDSIINNK